MVLKTLYDKIWDYHVINEQIDGTSLIYIDRHLVHEVTSPQAFEGLRINRRKVVEVKMDMFLKTNQVFGYVFVVYFNNFD